MMRIIIIGGGQVGAYVGRMMLDAGNTVHIIENRDRTLNYLKEEFPEAVVVVGDGADPNVLEKAGIASADVVAAVTGSDEINLVASTIAKFEFGVERVIARVNNPKNDWLYTFDMGVDVKISQASLLAQVIADQIDLENMVTLMRLNRGASAIVNATVAKGSQADGKQLKDLSIPESIVLIAIQRGEENIVPRGETELHPGDQVLAYTNTGEESILNDLVR